MDMETFLYVEWRIDNFSYWRYGMCLGINILGTRYELFPKGREDFLVLHIKQCLAFPSELLILAPDGSLIHKEHVNPSAKPKQRLDDMGNQYLEIPVVGLRFEDVVARIRKVEAEFGDSLTLQLRKDKDCNEFHWLTVIEVISTAFKIDGFELISGLANFDITYSDREDVLCLQTLESVTVDGEEEIKLTLDLTSLQNTSRPIWVLTQMSLLTWDGSLVRFEENEHVFHVRIKKNFSVSLTKRELTGIKIASLLLRIKIVTGSTNETYPKVRMYSRRTSIVPYNVISEQKLPKYFKDISYKPSETDSLSKDLMCLYQDQKFSDLTLKCANVTFPVHRNILSARSPVFESMLSSDMKETDTGQVDIGDLDPPTLALFLAFLYTGVVEDEDLQGEGALKLYYAADKYQVPSLKTECSAYFCSKVSVSNVCDILSLADKHQDDVLISVSHDFIVKNFDDVLCSEEWNCLVKSDPLLIAKTVTHLAQKKSIGKCNTT